MCVFQKLLTLLTEEIELIEYARVCRGKNHVLDRTKIDSSSTLVRARLSRLINSVLLIIIDSE